MRLEIIFHFCVGLLIILANLLIDSTIVYRLSKVDPVRQYRFDVLCIQISLMNTYIFDVYMKQLPRKFRHTVFETDTDVMSGESTENYDLSAYSTVDISMCH